ncbi:MAG: hypothetical protein LBO08_00255 [Rickettsiales bacterium]|jgi:integrase|nr:hypothetical protein [Rickettsiales bacterium]
MSHQFFFSPYILDNLVAPAAGFSVFQDIAQPKLKIYITARGVRTFFTRKRVHGRDQRIILGNYPETDIETARGILGDAIAARCAPIQKKNAAISVGALIKIWIRDKIKSKSKTLRATTRHFGKIWTKRLSAITADELGEIIRSIAESAGPAIACRMRCAAVSFFKHAVQLGYLEKNPAAGIPRIAAQPRHKNRLSWTALSKLVRAIRSEQDENTRRAFLMLVYGFANRSRIFSMRWSDIDFNQYAWHDGLLSDPAIDLIQEMSQDFVWLFPGRGRRHLTDPRGAWRRIVKNAGLREIQMNDVYKFLKSKLPKTGDIYELRAAKNDILTKI